MKRSFVFGKDIKGKRIRMKIKDLTFRPSVYGVIVKGRKTLLVPQWDGFDFPGGGVEIGESLENALKREVWEETGLKVEIGPVLECYDNLFQLPYNKRNIQSILMYFLCKNVQGKVSAKNFDKYEKTYAKKAEWVDIKKIGNLKFYNSADSGKIIKKALKEKL